MNNAFARGFFYRTHNKWNRLPLDVRESKSLLEFKSKLKKYLWKSVLEDATDDDYELDNVDADKIGL